MITMKKKVFLMALVGAALTACSNHDDVYSPEKYAEAKLQAKVAEYNAAFQKEFGTPAPGHTWGFGTSTRSAVTRAVCISEKNKWATAGYTAPADITKEEEDMVLKAFEGVKQSNIAIDFSEFFVQQVHKGTNTFKKTIEENGVRGNSQTQGDYICSNKMDYLTCGVSDATDDMLKNDDNHIRNFNNGNNTDGYNVSIGINDQGQDITTNYNYGISLMTEASTETFAYYSSEFNQVVKRYIILQIGVAYYVGFNFKGMKKETDTKNCYYERTDELDDYTDWIVKITPAKPNTTPKTQELFQVWCEDLGGEYGKNGNDFDFNDVVLSFVKNGDNTEIWLLAAGGTLELNVVWDGKSEEVHKAFGVGTSEMINTGRKTVEKKLLWSVSGNVTRDDLSRLEIQVKDSETGVWYKLNNTSSAPQMIVCEPKVIWPDERVNINDAFADDAFKKWVEGEPSKPFNGRRK